MDPDVAAHYELGHEADRLDTWGRLERERTMALLERHLPPALARVLDVGGGPRAYAVRLARAGYEVRLVDPVELHVAQAREASAAQPDAPLAGADLGDARALDAPDASADAVLFLGPLYHLPDAADRRRALSEARRVLRPGGVAAVAGISRFAPSIDGLAKGHLADEAYEATSRPTCARASTATRTRSPGPSGSRPPSSTAPMSSPTRSAPPASYSPRSSRSRASARSSPTPERGSTTPSCAVV